MRDEICQEMGHGRFFDDLHEIRQGCISDKEKGMWNYTEVDEVRTICLHDCEISRIKKTDDALIFKFSDGIWLLENNQNNPYGEILRTGEAEMILSGFELISVRLFESKKFFFRRVNVEKMDASLEELIEKINNSKWKMEFLDDFYNSNRIFYNCRVEDGKGGHYYDCQLIADYNRVIYHWNSLREDAKW